MGDDKFISCLLDVVYWFSGSFHIIQVGLAVLDRGIRCVTAGYKLKFELGESPALYIAVTQRSPYPVGWPLPPLGLLYYQQVPLHTEERCQKCRTAKEVPRMRSNTQVTSYPFNIKFFTFILLSSIVIADDHFGPYRVNENAHHNVLRT